MYIQLYNIGVHDSLSRNIDVHFLPNNIRAKSIVYSSIDTRRRCVCTFFRISRCMQKIEHAKITSIRAQIIYALCSVILTSYFDISKLNNVNTVCAWNTYRTYRIGWAVTIISIKSYNYLDFFFFNFSLSYYVSFFYLLIVADLEKRSWICHES